MKYPKIQTLYERDKKTFKVDTSKLRLEEFGMISPESWLITEKVDGTNVRVILHPDGEVEFRGRTDRAQFHPNLTATLTEMFPADQVEGVFKDRGDAPVILYGEGYGEKIQKGGKYREGMSFRLFDVRVGHWWLEFESVREIADKLDICTAPILHRVNRLPNSAADLDILFASPVGGSLVAWTDKGDEEIQAEGIVARSEPLLLLRNGDRLMWKLKYKDF